MGNVKYNRTLLVLWLCTHASYVFCFEMLAILFTWNIFRTSNVAYASQDFKQWHINLTPIIFCFTHVSSWCTVMFVVIIRVQYSWYINGIWNPVRSEGKRVYKLRVIVTEFKNLWQNSYHVDVLACKWMQVVESHLGREGVWWSTKKTLQRIPNLSSAFGMYGKPSGLKSRSIFI